MEFGSTLIYSSIKGYLLLEILISCAILSLLMLAQLNISVQFMSLFNAQNSALALFYTMHEARIRAMALDTDIVFNIQNNQFTQTSPSSQIEWRPYLGQTLSMSNASGTGFTGLGHTKFASTIRINGSDSPGVSLGVGYGKVNLK